jgi:hypothetical protein
MGEDGRELTLEQRPFAFVYASLCFPVNCRELPLFGHKFLFKLVEQAAEAIILCI